MNEPVHMGAYIHLYKDTHIQLIAECDGIKFGNRDSELTIFFMDEGAVDKIAALCIEAKATMERKNQREVKKHGR
jgi:hypothetical protein